MIGSRYVPGGGVEGWPWRRHLMSRGVNCYARWLLGLAPKDCSGGFRCYRTTLLSRLELDAIRSRGYSFQEEILWRLKRLGARFGETPITFIDRQRGASKIDSNEAILALWIILALGVRNWLRRQPPGTAAGGPSVSPLLVEAAGRDKDGLLAMLRTTAGGLSDEEATTRLHEAGPNNVAQERQVHWTVRLLLTYRDPLSILLTILAVISFFTGEVSTGVIIAVIVFLSVFMRFFQETRADAAVAKLKAMINITATVVRSGQQREVPLDHLVPGNVVALAAGDMVPADVRVLGAKDLFISQASLTGESFPVEKFDAAETRTGVAPLELSNICFMGTNVESGSATAAIVTTGRSTYFGGMAHSILGRHQQSSFDQGVQRFTWLMIRFMAVMVPAVFFINWGTKGNCYEAFFFALTVAVGLTPECCR